MDLPEDRALANLRNAIWRLGAGGAHVVLSSTDHIGLRESVRVDVAEMVKQCRAVLMDPLSPPRGDVLPLDPGDLLPGWYEDWIVFERDRLRQLHLNAVECLAATYASSGQPGLATEAAYAAISRDPLRESAWRVLVSAFLADGNVSDALSAYSECKSILDNELGIRPSEAMNRLIEPFTGRRRR